MTVPDYATIAQTMRQLAIDAGQATEAVRGAADLDVDHKADCSPVSEADLAADGIIVDGLGAAFGGIAIVTEERAETHTTEANRFFLIDPLDGTREFIGGSGQYTVNIALIEFGTPVLGVVYAPATRRLFWTPEPGQAASESGAFTEPPIPIRVRQAPAEGLTAISSRSHGNSKTDRYLAQYPVAGSTQAGSSLKFCIVAAGEADLYPRLGRTMEWDTGAGHAILAAAGGTVVVRDGQPLTYGKPGFDNAGFVAAGGGVDIITW